VEASASARRLLWCVSELIRFSLHDILPASTVTCVCSLT